MDKSTKNEKRGRKKGKGWELVKSLWARIGLLLSQLLTKRHPCQNRPFVRARGRSQRDLRIPTKVKPKKKSFYLVGKPYFVISNLAERDHPIPLSVIANCSWNARSMIS